MSEFFTHLFDSSGFPARWHCGDWSTGHGWLHIVSDLLVFLAYYIIPGIIAFFLARRRDLPFPRVLWLFVFFIFACGTTHALDALMFWEPIYRLSGLAKLVTALVSWATVFALIAVMPDVMRLRTPKDLEAEVASRTAELREAEGKLREADRRKNEFLSILGHELRNPLAPITSALELMERSPSNEFLHEREVIHRHVRHVTRLVDDLLDVSRIARGKVDLRRSTVALSAVMEDAVEHVHSLIASRDHALAIELEDDLAVNGDYNRIVQIFSNLLNNAAKYTLPGGHLELRARRVHEWCEVEVRDDGVGISESLLPRVFDLFTQGERSLERSEGGLGLGLAIVKQLVVLHDGSVSVTPNDSGRGTVFTVRLPHAKTESLRPPTPDDAEDRPTFTGRRMLLVDDNVDACELLGMLLTSIGFKVELAHSGDEALNKIANEQPDLAILDIGLPGTDGYELAGQIKAMHPSIRLIALSGYGSPDDLTKSSQAGFVEHLTKPVELSTLEAALRKALEPNLGKQP